MLDSYLSIRKGVELHCPLAGAMLAQNWVTQAFREVAERRQWSWLRKRAQFLIPALTSVGTASVTRNSNIVTGVGTAWNSGPVSLVGQQFRIALNTPIYDIASVQSNTQLTLSDVWGGATQANVGYNIYQAYVTVPSDFHAFVSVWDPLFNWQLWLHYSQEELNSLDAQRANQGTAYAVVDYLYDTVSTPPLPRYEIWPHQKAQYVYPFIYEARATDLVDPGASLPRYIRGDVLLEYALIRASLWPGPSRDQMNPYFNPMITAGHKERAERMIAEMETQDNQVTQSDVGYQMATGLPWSPFPMLDAAWLQAHSI